MELMGQPVKHVVVIMAFGAGVLVGSGASWWFVSHRLTNSLLEMRQEVNGIKSQMNCLQQCVHQLLSVKQSAPLSIAEEDDDVYEDAYDGY